MSRKRSQRDALIRQHVPLAARVARRLARRLPSFIPIEDLISAANMGLVDAADRFDKTLGTSFAAFAERRIRGAILDSLRSTDSMSRDMRRLNNYLSEKAAELAATLGRYPDRAELADALNVSVEKLDAMKGDALAGSKVMGYDDAMVSDGKRSILDVTADPNAVNALESVLRKELSDDLAEAIRDLPRQMQIVLSLSYSDGLNLKEIGKVMGFTESRACQILGEAVQHLRDMYTRHPGDA